MNNDEKVESYKTQTRNISLAQQGLDELGNLQLLPGRWMNDSKKFPGFKGRGWNMIALPFESGSGNLDYRMLVNQYNEILQFAEIDGPVPNRGIDRTSNVNTDQFLFALDYQQSIEQVAVANDPTGANIGEAGDAIHHEPGFFLAITNEQTDGLDIARLGTIPHGDSVLAMGRSQKIAGPPTFPPIDGRPIGATTDLTSPYLSPYVAFSGTNSFKGNIGDSEFPGFDVVEPHKLLQLGLPPNVRETTILEFDTKFETGGIVNIPFVVNQANATEMTATFYIMELDSKDDQSPTHALAYSQVVMLEFFDRFDGQPGLIKWPHVSINTMVFDGIPTPEMMRIPQS